MYDNFKFDFKIFNNFHDMCFIISHNGVILNFNSTVKETLGFNKIDIINKKLFDFIDEPYLEKSKSIVNNHLETKGGNIFVKIKRKTGLVDADLTYMPFTYNGKRNIFVLARNITEDKNKEINLRRFNSVANKTINSIQITDENGKMIYVNPAYVKASGYSEEELLGKDPKVFGSGKHSMKFWENMWNTIKSGNVWIGEIENRKKSGEPFYSQAIISPIADDDGKIIGYFGIHNDIADKKMLEKNLIHSQKMENIGILAAGIAHEVGNPLASISALVQVVQRTSSEKFAIEKLELVKSQVKRISKTIRDLVDFSRPSNYELRLTDINKNILDAVEIIKAGIKVKSIEFILKLNSEIPPLALVQDQIEQVFVNILINAIDAIADDKKDLKKIFIYTDIIKDSLIITFEDTGIGIYEEDISKIFEPFFTTKEEGKGTGLGLWITYGIIKSFQGDITVESTKGVGSKFILTLPVNK